MLNFLDSWKDKRSTVIVFAGIFDPVHIAHISAAEEALKSYGSKLVFLPEKEPQHKKGVTEYRHRLEMLKIATKSQLNMQVLDYPCKKQYIEETFSWLKAKFPNNKFIWLIGADVLPQVNRWPGHEKLKESGVEQIVVFIRGDKHQVLSVKEIGGASVVYKKRTRAMLNHENISSSYVLEDLKHRQSALPTGVYDYIKANNLYSVTDSLSE
jgi:nicotinate (nicotinamide) nucleotide adenylyltransferase